MKRSVNAVTVTLWAARLVALVMFVLLFTLPALLDWYCLYRALQPLERTALTIAFYCCSVAVFWALWQMDGLLRSIRRGEVFVIENVRRIGTLQWCCGAVALICIPAAFCYYPLVFMVAVMGFLCLAVSVLRQVMSAAVTLQEENDLTI